MSEVLIVGSGVGGATIAKELAVRGKKVTILEKGHYHRLGTERRSRGFYSVEKTPEGVEIFRAFMVGGTSVITLANGVRSLQTELSILGLDLVEEEFSEAERELKIAPVPEKFLGERARRLMTATTELGYDVKVMPKFIDFSKCKGCGMCVFGCQYGAKWSSQNFIGEAQRAGAKLLTDTTLDQVLHSNGAVKGVRVRGPSGSRDIEATKIAAGGLGTPVILQRSGIDNAGSHLFADLVVETYGLLNEGNMKDELGMSVLIDDFHKKDGFILSPVLSTTRNMFLNLYQPLSKKMQAFARKRTLAMMTKITYDDAGRIDRDGTIHKPVTESDRRKLDKGDAISREILTKAGVNPRTLYTTKITAGHPGGTAGIGRVVNKDLETEVHGLFVSDASVFPQAPGLPPVLTIIALSKRLSKRLAED
jgi:choline dehydrogenase-like flavoprotein